MTSTPSTPYLINLLRYMIRTNARMTATDMEIMFGQPGGPGKLETRVKAWAAHGYLRTVHGGVEACYAATGEMPDQPGRRDPDWRMVGRNAPRVASVFDLAGGVTR